LQRKRALENDASLKGRNECILEFNVLSFYLLSVEKVSFTTGGDIENSSDTKGGFVSKPRNVFKAASAFHKRFFLNT
jgi:hypothetical protein